MTNEDVTALIGPLIIAAVLLYTGVQRTRSVLARRRRELALAGAGVRTYGTVTAVGPFDRSTGRHPLTVQVNDGRGPAWTTVEKSGTGGYFLREGTPVTLLYTPQDPSNARIERAAFPERSMGDYLVRLDDDPRPPSLAAALTPLTGSLVVVVVLALFALNSDRTALELVPPIFFLAGLGLLAYTVFRLITGKAARPDHSASTTGAVTDCWTETRRVRRRNRRGKRTVRVHPFTIHFRTPDGREVHVRHPVATGNFTPSPQHPLRIDYDPSHPPRYALADHPNASHLLVSVPLFVGVVLTFLGAVTMIVL